MFLAKSTNPPFGFIYEFLFTNFPGFFMFRDASKFYLMILIGVSVLLGISIKLLNEKFKKHQKVILCGALLLIVLSYYPFLLNQPFATLDPKPTPDDYVELKNWILSQDEDYFAYFMPWFPTTAFNNKDHPWLTFNAFSNNLRYFFHIYVPSTTLVNKSKYVNDVFGLYNIKQVVLLRDPEVKKFTGGLSFEEYERILASQGLNESARFGNFSVYEINNPSTEVFSVKNPIYIIGGLDSLISLSQLNYSLSNNLFFFNTINSNFEFNKSDLIIFNNKSLNELVFSLYDDYFDEDYEYEIIGQNADFDLNSPELMFNPNKNLVNFNISFNDSSEKVLIRGVFNSSDKFTWLDLDNVENAAQTVSFDNVLLDVVVRINRSDYGLLLSDVLSLISNKNLIVLQGSEALLSELDLTEITAGNLTYYSNIDLDSYSAANDLECKKIDKTTYTMNVTGSNSCFIVFSKNYDNNWCINDSCSIKGNVVLNSIYVDNCSQSNLILSYKPQSIMDFAWSVSLVSFLIIGFLLVIVTLLNK
jgi:hypothetical protein